MHKSFDVHKYIYLLWESESRALGRNRAILLEQCAPALSQLGPAALSINVDDEFSTVKSPAPKCYRGPEISATVSLYVAEPAAGTGVEGVQQTAVDAQPTSAAGRDILVSAERILERAGFAVAGYRVEESIYKDYGDNRHSAARDWPDGQRSPGVLAVTLLTKPSRLSHAQWIKRWHGCMSPISERIQPRQRYVRNVVMRPLTTDAPPFDGIVEEAWPSAEHISNPYLFYCADNRWQLFKHVMMMLYAIFRFHHILKFRTTTMSEYFIKSGGVIEGGPGAQADRLPFTPCGCLRARKHQS